MRVLVVEDEKRMADSIKHGLELHRFAVDVYSDFESGLAAAPDPDYDIILLDRRLPDGHDGLEICRELRADNIKTPVIMLTAFGEVRDRVTGLMSGADDYIVKPFSLDELVARIQAILRRPHRFSGTILTVDDLSLDPGQHEVKRGKDAIRLTPKEYAIVFYMMQHHGQTLSKEQIVSHIWDEGADILAATVETHISSLRKKIDESYPKRPPLIHTVWGFGYKLGAEA